MSATRLKWANPSSSMGGACYEEIPLSDINTGHRIQCNEEKVIQDFIELKFLDTYLKLENRIISSIGEQEQRASELSAKPEPSSTAQKNALFELVQFGFKEAVERLGEKSGASDDFMYLQELTKKMEEEHYNFIAEQLKKHVNSRDEQKRTPLHVCTNGVAAKALIDNEAVIYAEDINNLTPLHNEVAAQAVVEKEKLHLACAKTNDEEYDNMKKLLACKQVAEAINFQNKQGRTALHLAKRKRVVELLIKEGANVNATDKQKNTPLHLVSEREEIKDQNDTINFELIKFITTLNGELPEIVETLLSHGANPNAQDSLDMTPLHRSKTKSVVEILIKNGADIHAKDYQGYLALHWAVVQNNKEKVRILLQQSSSTINTCTKEGDTSLHIAVAPIDDVKKTKTNETSSSANEDGRTSLQTSVATGTDDLDSIVVSSPANQDDNDEVNSKEDIMQLLLEKGAKLKIHNATGDTPLHLAAKNPKSIILKALIDTKPSEEILQITNRRGRTPLHLAAGSGHHELLEDLHLKNLHCVVDHEGNNMLHLAAIHKQLEVMKKLFEVLEKNEIPLEDIPNKDGDTALHLATREGCEEIVGLLLNKFDGKYVYNARNVKGCTPIHIAAMKGHRHILAIMLRRHMPLVNSRNWEGATSLHLAVENKHENVAVMLLEHYMGDLRCEVHGISTKKLWKINFPSLECKPPTLDELKEHYDTQNLLLSALQFERDDLFQERLSQLSGKEVIENDEKYTLLQVACLLGFHTCVEDLLERNTANHLITSRIEGGCKEYPLLLAASWGYFDIVCKYKSYYKTNFTTTENDETGLHILTKGFQNRLKNECSFFSQVNLNKTSQDYDRCVQELVHYFAQQGTFSQQITAMDKDRNTPFYYCINNRSEETIVAMLSNGANPWTFDKDDNRMIDIISRETIEKYLDTCVYLENAPGETSLQASIKYDIIQPYGSMSEIETLKHISESKKHKSLLKHPVFSTFLSFKWKRMFFFFMLNLIIYLLFMLSWTIQALLLTYTSSSRELNGTSYQVNGTFHELNGTSHELNGTSNQPNSTALQLNDEVIHMCRNVFWYFAVIIWPILCARELIQFCISPLRYSLSLENWMELSVFISCGVTFFDDQEESTFKNRQLIAIITLFGWLEFILLLGRIPHGFFKYVRMFTAVMKNYTYAFFAFISLIFGFVIAFKLVFTVCDGFLSSECEAIVTSINGTWLQSVMMVIQSEIEVDSFLKKFQTFASYVVFILFFFLVVLVLVNLLNALAVSETQVIINDAQLYGLICIVDMACSLEPMLDLQNCLRKKLASCVAAISAGLGIVGKALKKLCCQPRDFFLSVWLCMLPKFSLDKITVKLMDGRVVANSSWKLPKTDLESLRALVYYNDRVELEKNSEMKKESEEKSTQERIRKLEEKLEKNSKQNEKAFIKIEASLADTLCKINTLEKILEEIVKRK